MRGGLTAAALALSFSAARAGTWTQVTNTAPGGGELMILMGDGTVMAQNGGGNAWCKLTPDSRGNYANGSWSTIASMNDTRLYGSSGLMPNGKIFYAGAEYGTGRKTSEVYDPIANTWTRTPDAGQDFYDSVSTILPNGNVLVGPVFPNSGSASTQLYDYNVNNIGDQMVSIYPKTSGKFKFYFKHDGMSWDIPGANAANNVVLGQYPENGSPAQEFSLERTPSLGLRQPATISANFFPKPALIVLLLSFRSSREDLFTRQSRAFAKSCIAYT